MWEMLLVPLSSLNIQENKESGTSVHRLQVLRSIATQEANVLLEFLLSTG